MQYGAYPAATCPSPISGKTAMQPLSRSRMSEYFDNENLIGAHLIELVDYLRNTRSSAVGASGGGTAASDDEERREKQG